MWDAGDIKMQTIDDTIKHKLYNTLDINPIIELEIMLDIISEITGYPKGVILPVIEEEKMLGKIYEPRVDMLSKVR